MAQLGGKSVRTVVTQLEIQSDDGQYVVSIRGMDGGGVTLKLRRPWESEWGGGIVAFTLNSRDASAVSKAINGQDVSWDRSAIDEITTNNFHADDPNPPVEDEAKDEDCSQLDIERARAANLAEERELLRLSLIRDHNLDKHATAYVDGCETCEKTAAYLSGKSLDPDGDEPFGEDAHLEAEYESRFESDLDRD